LKTYISQPFSLKVSKKKVIAKTILTKLFSVMVEPILALHRLGLVGEGKHFKCIPVYNAKSPSPGTDVNNIPCILTFLPNQKNEGFSR
jgi:hypothetical protein